MFAKYLEIVLRVITRLKVRQPNKSLAEASKSDRKKKGCNG